MSTDAETEPTVFHGRASGSNLVKAGGQASKAIAALTARSQAEFLAGAPHVRPTAKVAHEATRRQ